MAAVDISKQASFPAASPGTVLDSAPADLGVDEVEQYFREHPDAAADPYTLRWRVFCFEQGVRYVKFVEETAGALSGLRVFDLACGWGGHALAFASRGASVAAADLTDYDFARLNSFASARKLNLQPLRGDCQRLAFAPDSFDVILALEVMEHITDPRGFAREVARTLRPGGICFLTTPARCRSIFGGEPHYRLRGLAALPFFLQPFVARVIFNRSYPYPITRQYSLASSVIAPFAEAGLQGEAVLQGKLAKAAFVLGPVHRLVRSICWNFVLLRKPLFELPDPD